MLVFRAAPDYPPQVPRGMFATCALALAALAASAHADEVDSLTLLDEGYQLDSWPRRVSVRPFTLPVGVLELRGDLATSLGESPLEPTLLAPDLRLGLRRSMTLAVEHDVGLCLGASATCPVRYGGLFGGIDLSLVDVTAKFQLGVEVAAGVMDIDPFTLATRVAVPWRVLGERFGVDSRPGVTIRLNHREPRRREELELPLTLLVQATPTAALFVGAALTGPVDALDEAIVVPIWAGATLSLARRLDVGASFTFTNLAGTDGGLEGRMLTLFAVWRR